MKMGYRWSLVLVISLYLELPLGSCLVDEDVVDQEGVNSAPTIISPYDTGRHLAVTNEDVKILCKYYGTPKPFVAWYKNDVRISSHDNDRIKIQRKWLKISKAEYSDSGNYSCHVFNDFGNKWINVTLIVRNQTDIDTMLQEYGEFDSAEEVTPSDCISGNES